MNLKKTLDSGSILEVTLAPFEVGHKLLKSVMKELESVKISMGVKAKSLQEFFDLDVNDEAINTLKNLLTRLIGSELVEESLWACMERATYNNKKINRDTFEEVKAREDFLIVAKEVLWFNLSPFLKNISSLFQGIQVKSTQSQK
jgi:hypothetical protein